MTKQEFITQVEKYKIVLDGRVSVEDFLTILKIEFDVPLPSIVQTFMSKPSGNSPNSRMLDMSTKIKNTSINWRLLKVLRTNVITGSIDGISVGDLLYNTETEVLAFKGMGVKTFKHLTIWLKRYKLKLKK